MGNALAPVSVLAAVPVHPHAHGERKRLLPCAPRRTGSSPRTWGTRLLHCRRYLFLRFIPTHMGNAPTQATPCALATVHPHAHGERVDANMPQTNEAGSSPRTWGTPASCRLDTSLSRFIPTHMGNADSGEMYAAVDSVHPHAHGERADHYFLSHSKPGSSPRTWGTPQKTQGTCPLSRFIPTHMGNA